jgi:hypothetical protein
MLTRDDLEQIRGIVREEVRSEVSTQLKEARSEVSTQLRSVNRKLDRLQKDMTFIVKDYSNAICT